MERPCGGDWEFVLEKREPNQDRLWAGGARWSGTWPTCAYAFRHMRLGWGCIGPQPGLILRRALEGPYHKLWLLKNLLAFRRALWSLEGPYLQTATASLASFFCILRNEFYRPCLAF